MPDPSDPRRLEALWAGPFGNDYIKRNFEADPRQRAFWATLFLDTPVASVLEVGCNVGINLAAISEFVPAAMIAGIDINDAAVQEARRRVPGAAITQASARKLPFDNGSFDLVLTMGVLIHQPDSSLAGVMREMHRCSSRFLLTGEYYADEPREIPYRGVKGALFKRDYGGLFTRQFDDLQLSRSGFLSRDEGWDEVTWWLFEKVL